MSSASINTARVDNQDIVAIGEIGLDYSRLEDDQLEVINTQRRLFKKQIELANAYDLPVVIHSRDATVDTLEILREMKPKGVWHSFTGTDTELVEISDLGLYIGINGIVTFPSAKTLAATVSDMPLERLIIETDCPFLAPQEYRGQRCEPWMVHSVARFIADMHSVSVDEIDEITTYNAEQLFGVELA